jgi:uncharacterized protein YecE (DUF72 family)
LKQAEWLSFYARSFDTVEINATFYRLPKPEYVRRWAEETPGDFLFSIKGSRYLTHVKKLGMTGEPVDRFFDVIGSMKDKAGPVLWQLPPALTRNDDRLAEFVSALPGDWRHTFEFRHPSWFCQEIYDILERAGAALCVPVHPESPREVLLTADWTYFRFHYGRGKDGRFTPRQLQEWAGRINDLRAQGAGDVYAYFNNDWHGFAIENARDLIQLLK